MARTTSFLISEDLLRDLSPLSGDLDYDYLYPHLLVAQDKWIQPKLGTQLYERLMDGIDQANLNADETLLLDDYIAKPLIHFAMYEAMPYLAIKMVNSGIVQRIVDDGNPISLSEAEKMADKERSTGEWYMQRLIDYLCAESSKFPEYSAPRESGDVEKDNSNYSGGLNLGPPEKKPWYLSSGD